MADPETIKTTFERNAKAVELRPSKGQGTATTTVRLLDGVACEIEEGPWKLVSDMTKKSGGEEKGPNPGILSRAALGSCLVIAYALWAAKRELPLSSLEVEVQADYDARGMYGVDDVDPGYTQIRYVVRVESPAPEEEVMRVLDEADAHCDNLFVFRDPQDIRREVQIAAPRS